MGNIENTGTINSVSSDTGASHGIVLGIGIYWKKE